MISRRLLALLAVLAVMPLLAAGCTLEREFSFKVHPDWSRGRVAGYTSLRQPVGMAVDDLGTYLVWGSRQEEGTQLVFGHLDPTGLPVTQRVLEANTFFPRLPQLVAGDNLELFVITRLASGERDGVYRMRLDRAGMLLEAPERLSGREQKSESVVVTVAADGLVHLVWDVVDGPGLGVYHALLRPGQPLEGFPQLFGPSGTQPAAQADGGGTLHVAWFREKSPGLFDLYYTTMAPGARTGDEPVIVATPRIPITDVTQPLTLGLDSSHVYLLWSQEHRTGLLQGVAETSVVAFPVGQPGRTEPANLLISQDSAPTYEPTTQFPPFTQVSLPSTDTNWTSLLEGPIALQQQTPQDSLIVLADMGFDFRFENRPQLVLLIFQDGRLVGYQQPVRTRQYSMRPRGLRDAAGQIHLTWIDLEQPGNFSVYYASTAPAVQAVLNRRTGNDTFLDAIDVLWGMLAGVSLVPLLGIVLLPVLLSCGIFYLSGNDDSLSSSWSARLTFVVSVILYLGAKILVMAAILARPPLMNVVPEVIRPIWIGLAVLIVASLAGLAVWIYYRRSQRPFLFRAALTFALVDAMLTVILYGPTFYGE